MPTYRSSTVLLAHTYGRIFACCAESRVRALLLRHRHAVMCARADRARLRKACACVSGWSLFIRNLLQIRYSESHSRERERERESWCGFGRVAHSKLRKGKLLYANFEPLFDRTSRRFSAKMDRLANEGQSGRWKRILQSYCVVIFDDRRSRLCVHAHVQLVQVEWCRRRRRRRRKSLSTFPIGQKFKRVP